MDKNHLYLLTEVIVSWKRTMEHMDSPNKDYEKGVIDAYTCVIELLNKLENQQKSL
jgi:hypothetical protein